MARILSNTFFGLLALAFIIPLVITNAGIAFGTIPYMAIIITVAIVTIGVGIKDLNDYIKDTDNAIIAGVWGKDINYRQ